MDHRVFLVGESNPYGSDPRFALYPQPPNATGGRLARVLGMADDEYLHAFERRNLLHGSWVKKIKGGWSAPLARSSADDLLRDTEHSDRLVLLGAKVSAAFGVDFRRNLCLVRWFQVGTDVLRWRWVLVVPHPSGRSREWNDPAMRAKVKEAVERIREEDVDSLRPDPDLRAVMGENAQGQRLVSGPAWEGECPQAASSLPAQIAALPEGDQREVDRFTKWLAARARWVKGESTAEEFASVERDLFPNGLGAA